MNCCHLAQAGTTHRREALAGFTTFLTMAYIVAVNPSILAQTGMDRGALITVTILAAMIGTLLAGLWGRVPYAMAPGMGLNAYFAYGLVLEQKVTWQTGLGVVFLSGLFFLLLTVTGLRKTFIRAIPLSLRLSIPCGIGLFISFIGFRNLGLIEMHPATLVHLAPMSASVVLGLLGLLLMVLLDVRRFPGALLVGMLSVTAAGWILQLNPMPEQWLSLPPSILPLAFELDILGALRWSLLGAIFSFMFVDLFDSVGTIVACSYEAGRVDESGEIEGVDRILEADAVSTMVGAVLGTSTTTTYIESGSGIAAGGRTGLTSVWIAVCFGLCLFASPLITAIPAYATGPALVLVGIYMLKSIHRIPFANLPEGVPAFLTIVLMPMTHSISTGLIFGFLSYVLIALFNGTWKDLHPAMWAIAALSALQVAW